MSQRQQLERILEIDRAIRAKEYPNAAQLAQRLEVSRRVIFYDCAFMKDRLGAPIEYDRQRRGWYYSEDTWILPNIMITQGELLAFFLSVEVARSYLGTALEQPLRNAVTKIEKVITGHVSVNLEALRAHYTFQPPIAASIDVNYLLELHQSIQACKRVRILYYTASRGERNERTLDPYHLYNWGGEWYLVGFDHLRQQVRNFHVGRIERLTTLPEKFNRQAEFSIENWMGQAFLAERGEEATEVVIRFDEEQARYIRERRWHESQTIEELSDGGLVLRFKTGGLGAVRRWVMQYGSHAQVLSPLELREQVREEAQRMTKLYLEGKKV